MPGSYTILFFTASPSACSNSCPLSSLKDKINDKKKRGGAYWQEVIQFSSVQFSRSVISDSLHLHGLQHARLPCPSPTPGIYSDSCPLSRWCHPTILFFVIPFSCLQSFPASGKLISRRIDPFDLWCRRRLLRVPWTARRSNQSILKEISPECSLERLKLKLQYFGHLMWRSDSFEKSLILGKTEAEIGVIQPQVKELQELWATTRN